MRFGLAIASLVLAGILLILGIGQRTFLAGPAEIVYPVNIESGVEYAVIHAGELDAVGGQPNLMVVGAEGFAAVGSDIDVEAWLRPVEHTELSIDTGARELSGSTVPAVRDGDAQGETPAEDDGAAAADDSAAADDGAAAGEPEEDEFDPRGSDLWVEAQEGPGRLPVVAEEDQSIIVQAGNGSAVSIAWVQDRRTPLAGPLLVAGGVFALLGLVLYLLAVDHDRRGLGPRRGRRGLLPGIRGWIGGGRGAEKPKQDAAQNPETRKPETTKSETPKPGSARRLRPLALPALGVAAALTLSGCSAGYWPDFSSSKAVESEATEAPASSAAPVPVTPAQIDRIVESVVEVSRESDEALDAETLAERFSGDALTQRVSNYTIRGSVSDYEVVLPKLTNEQLDYELVQSTEDWPRTLFVTVASEDPNPADPDSADPDSADTAEEGASGAEGSGDSAEGGDASPADPAAFPSIAMVLRQESPHDNYLVTRLFSLRGGISMPPAAPAEEGTALLADDMQSLVLPPGQVGEVYAKVLAGDTANEQAELFDLTDDPIIAKSGAAWVAAAQQAAADGGTDVEYTVSAAQSDSPIVSLSTGVGGALVTTTVLETRVEKQTGTYQPKAVGAFAALSGLSGRQSSMVSTVAHQLLFFVPSGKSGEEIQLLGYTTELVEATN